MSQNSDNQITLFIRDEKNGSARLQRTSFEGFRHRSITSARTGVASSKRKYPATATRPHAMRRRVPIQCASSKKCIVGWSAHARPLHC